MSTLPQRWRISLAGCLLLFVYVAAGAILPRDVFWHPDAGAKFLTLRSLHWDGGLSYSIPYRAAALDPALQYPPSHCKELYPIPLDDGGVQFHWGIWFPLATLPFVELLGWAGLYLLPILTGWLTALLAGRMTRAFAPALAPIAILLAGLGTPIAFYSLNFSEHTAATFLGTAALSLVVLSPPGRFLTLVWITPLLLVAALLRFEMLAFAIALYLGWAVPVVFPSLAPGGAEGRRTGRRSGARWLYLIGLCLLPLVFFPLAQWMPDRYYHYFKLIPQALGMTRAKLPYIVDIVVDIFINSSARLPGRVSSERWELAALLALGVTIVAPFVRRRRVEPILTAAALFVLFQLSALVVLGSRAYISSQGIIAVAPYMAAGVYVLPEAWRRRQGGLVSLVVVALAYLLTGFLTLFVFRVGSTGTYLVGLDGGVRYMLTLYPMGAVLSLVALRVYRASDRPPLAKSAFTVLIVALMLVALQYQLRGLQMLYDNRRLIATWEEALPEDEPVVTDIWWLPAAIGPGYTRREMSCVVDGGELAGWSRLAAAHGVRWFTFASRDAPPTAPAVADGWRLRRRSQRFVKGMHLARYEIEPLP